MFTMFTTISWGGCAVLLFELLHSHFPFQKEMMVKREIQERRGNMAKWDAWGQKVSAMT